MMNAPFHAGWKAHEIVDGGHRLQVLVRRTARVADTARCSSPTRCEQVT